MNIHPDFKELLRLLEEKNVEYMIVGGYAVAYHGYPRFTKDIDIFYDRSEDNAVHLQEALLDFGFSAKEVPLDAIMRKGNILTFGAEPNRVDMINDIDGVSFDEARENIVRGRYGDVEVNFIGVEELICNKEATPHMKDKADAEMLQKELRGED